MAVTAKPLFEATQAAAVETTAYTTPLGTRAIIDKLNAATRAAVQRAEVKNRIEPSGTVLIGNSPKEFGQIIRDDLARWGKVITLAKVTPEY